MERSVSLDWAEIVEEARRRRQDRKLTQRRLAAMANVSLPTVVRFEKNARDIQLSSALAILNVLDMVERPIEGSLLVRGPSAGPYRVMFAPSAGAGRPLAAREIAARSELDGFVAGLGIDDAARERLFADLVRDEIASIPGLQIRPAEARRLWPEQFS
jgi:transcriptional regulator with XRE-family HTH domain